MIILTQLEYNTADITHATGFQPRDQRRWLERYEATGAVEEDPNKGARTDRVEARQETIAKLKELCEEEHRDAGSSRTLARHVVHQPRQVRRLMHEGSVSSGYFPMVPVPRLTRTNMAKRLAFAQARRRQGWRNVAITDSKIFVGELTSNKAMKIRCWHPAQYRRRAPVKKHSDYQFHVYGGVTIYGGVGLYRVTGTTGMVSNYQYQRGARRGEQHRGVCGQEYRDVAASMIEDLGQLFNANGVEQWVFQQDGAGAHKSAATMDFIRERAPEVMEDWPPCSPDLSWIENVWAIMEQRLWRDKEWANSGEFEHALMETWHEVTGHLELMGKMAASMRTRLEKVVENGGGESGY